MKRLKFKVKQLVAPFMGANYMIRDPPIICSLFNLLCYAALLKNLPIMLKLMLNIYLLCSNYAQYYYLSSHVFLITLYFMEKQ